MWSIFLISIKGERASILFSLLDLKMCLLSLAEVHNIEGDGVMMMKQKQKLEFLRASSHLKSRGRPQCVLCELLFNESLKKA